MQLHIFQVCAKNISKIYVIKPQSGTCTRIKKKTFMTPLGFSVIFMKLLSIADNLPTCKPTVVIQYLI